MTAATIPQGGEELSTAAVLPVVDLSVYLNDKGNQSAKETLCTQVAELLKQSGCLVVRLSQRRSQRQPDTPANS
jgi:hypothetical protein